MRGRIAKIVAPWAFKTAHANTYVVSTKLNKTQLVEAFKKPKMPFRDGGTGADAAPHNSERVSAVPVPGEHGDERGNQGDGAVPAHASETRTASNSEWASAHTRVGCAGPPSQPGRDDEVYGVPCSEASGVDAEDGELLFDKTPDGDAVGLVVATYPDYVSVAHADLEKPIRIASPVPKELAEYLIVATRGKKISPPVLWDTQREFHRNNAPDQDRETDAKGQPNAGTGRRVLDGATNAMVNESNRSSIIRGVGEKVSHSKTGAADGRKRRGKANRARGKARSCEELSQIRNLAQDGRPPEHQSSFGRVSVNSGPVRGGYRGSGPQCVVPGEGYEPEAPGSQA